MQWGGQKIYSKIIPSKHDIHICDFQKDG